MQANQDVKRFEQIKAEEQRQIQQARGDQHDRFVGLALSGGGIRSATFCLGVLQALAELKLLRAFDYLSTVSGGGYIGSWLSALIRRQPQIGDGARVAAVENLLSPYAAWREPGLGAEVEPIRFLRRYSNYLTPKRGIFSADTWHAAAIYCRNLLLNQLSLVCAALLLLLLPYLLAALGNQLAQSGGLLLWLGLPTGGMLLAAPLITAWRLPLPSVPSAAELSDAKVLRLCVLPLLLGLFGLSLLLWLEGARLYAAAPGGFLGSGVLAGALLALAHLARRRLPAPTQWQPEQWKQLWFLLAAGLAAGALFGLSVQTMWRYGLSDATALPEWLSALCQPFLCAGPNHWLAVWWVLGVNTPWLVLTLLLAGVLYVGLAKRAIGDMTREWLGRLSGWIALLWLGWMVLFALTLLGPPLLMALPNWLPAWMPNGGLLAWLGSTVIAVLLGNSPWLSGEGSRHVRLERLIQVGPYLFLAGLALLLEYAVYCWMVGGATLPSSGLPFGQLFTISLHYIAYASESQLLLALGASLALLLLLNFHLDINALALHQFYRNRLTRAYLGASRFMKQRRPSPFTDLDPADDLPLAAAPQQPAPLTRPLHLLNATVNLTASRENAWQYRKGASFVFSPLFCGYQTTDMAGQVQGGYRASTQYMGGVWNGTAMAVSGAAASPNMGYHSSPAMAALLTVFNVRLGRWCPNTAAQVRCAERKTPRGHTERLLLELFGASDTRSDWLYLSDGGHFDNLGLYELVRRGCRTIVLSDAGADPEYGFEDLANAIRKCYSDLGVQIDIDLAPLRPDPGSGCSAAHVALGTIHYDWAYRGPAAARPQPGLLVYLKASLCGDESSDIRQYAGAHPEFPHQSTRDQWFDENQFESYRKLGHHIALQLFRDAKAVAAFGSRYRHLHKDKQQAVYEHTEYELERLFAALADQQAKG